MGETITKAGSGTLTLSGASTYTDGTTVSGGTLLVNNTSGSGTGTGVVGVTGFGTTLGGTGIISGSVVVAAEQTLRLATAVITPQFFRQAHSHCRRAPIFELISTARPLAADMTESR